MLFKLFQISESDKYNKWINNNKVVRTCKPEFIKHVFPIFLKPLSPWTNRVDFSLFLFKCEIPGALELFDISIE